MWQFWDVFEYDAEPQGIKRLSGLTQTNLTKRHTPAVSTDTTTSIFFIFFPYVVFILNECVAHADIFALPKNCTLIMLAC